MDYAGSDAMHFDSNSKHRSLGNSGRLSAVKIHMINFHHVWVFETRCLISRRHLHHADEYQHEFFAAQRVLRSFLELMRKITQC